MNVDYHLYNVMLDYKIYKHTYFMTVKFQELFLIFSKIIFQFLFFSIYIFLELFFQFFQFFLNLFFEYFFENYFFNISQFIFFKNLKNF